MGGHGRVWTSGEFALPFRCRHCRLRVNFGKRVMVSPDQAIRLPEAVRDHRRTRLHLRVFFALRYYAALRPQDGGAGRAVSITVMVVGVMVVGVMGRPSSRLR